MVTRWLGLTVAALVAAGCQDAGKEQRSVTYQPMARCFYAPPLVQSLGGEARTTVLPRLAGDKLEALGLIAYWWPGQGRLNEPPTSYFVADARDNSFVGRTELGPQVLDGVPGDGVESSAITRSELEAVFHDMDIVLPDFAERRPPTAPDVVAARDRLRTAYPRTMAKEHVIVYQRLSPAWFAFLDGDPKFAEKVAP
jgi:hypothetical protein